MVARSCSVLQEQTEVMEAVVWRCSSGGPWRSSGGARREVRGGRLEALAAGGGKAGSCAAQRMQNGADCTPEASTERVWSWELQVDGGQEPFSPTGTDGGDGGARREVRGGRLEVLAVRSVAVVWREGREPCSPRDAERLHSMASVGAKAEELIICIMYGQKCAVCKWNVSFAFQED
ncbi:unnamed protein product [Boreogadus saida]